MNIRTEWMSNNQLFGEDYQKQEFLDVIKSRFDEQRYNSLEGFQVSILNDIVSSTPVNEQVVIQDFTNPLNEHREDRKIHFDIDSVAHRGSYISWKNRYWLVLTKVESNEVYLSAKITECNNDFKFVDEFGNIRSFPCVIEDKVDNTAFDNNPNIIVPSGTIFVFVQRNEYVDKITENKRFLFDGQAFKVNFVKNFIDKNLVRFTMEKNQVNLATDDKINNIADVNQNNYEINLIQDSFEQTVGYVGQLNATLTINGQVSTQEIEWISSNKSIVNIDSDGNFECLAEGEAVITCRMVFNNSIYDTVTITVNPVIVVQKENRVSPQTFDIIQNQSITYDVYQFENDIQNSSGFNFTLSGASSTKYTAQILNNNQIKITSKGYDSVKLTVLATNLIDSSTVNWQIQLKNLW